MKFRWILLSILNSGRKTGYDVKQLVDDQLGYFWHVTAPQVYGELKKLEGLGWVTKEVGPSKRGPQRHYFQLTRAGETALHSALLTTPGEIESRDEWKCLWWVVSKSGNKQKKIHFLNQLIADKESRLLKVNERIASSTADPKSHSWDEFLSGWIVSELENSIRWAREALNNIDVVEEDDLNGEDALPAAEGETPPQTKPGEIKDEREPDYDPFAGLNDSTLL